MLYHLIILFNYLIIWLDFDNSKIVLLRSSCFWLGVIHFFNGSFLLYFPVRRWLSFSLAFNFYFFRRWHVAELAEAHGNDHTILITKSSLFITSTSYLMLKFNLLLFIWLFKIFVVVNVLVDLNFEVLCLFLEFPKIVLKLQVHIMKWLNVHF